MKSSELDDYAYNSQAKHHKRTSITMNITVTVAIMTLATVLSVLFRGIGLQEPNIIIAYILGVLLVAKQTEGYTYGIFASFIGVLTFNFLFTEPHYSLVVHGPDYPITFVIMLIIAMITSTLTTKAKKETRLSLIREKRVKILYQISRNLLKVRSFHQIVQVGVEDIAELLNRSVIIATVHASGRLDEPYMYVYDNDKHTDVFNSLVEIQDDSERFMIGWPIGAGTELLANSSAYYVPIKGQSGILGIVGVSCYGNKLLSEEQKTLLEAVTTQISLAMERERLLEKQQESQLEVERERLRGNLLRSISHDLRTPLTGILGATVTILDHGDTLNREVQSNLLRGVYEDASWLIHSVENILSITRIDEGNVEIKKSMEAVEEVVAEAVSRMKKLSVNHIMKVNIPEELIMLPMDGNLIVQVLVNLIDNAIKYTAIGSIIEIKSQLDADKVIFEVSDNGNGLSDEILPFIFNRFYTAASINDLGRQGTGLGLAICKSIILAHGGEITAFNNSSRGATFRVALERE